MSVPGLGLTGVAGCLPCELEDSADDAIVFRDETWSCEVAPGYDVPGWYILRLRRHAEGWEGLVPAELAGFGARCEQLSSAVKDALGASHVYFMSFGENYPHFHFLVTARDADTPLDRRGGSILTLRATHRDMASALAVLPALRVALAAEHTTNAQPDPRSPDKEHSMKALTTTSKPFIHTATGSGAAAGLVLGGRANRIVDAPARPDVPLIVALHGGTYTSEYFDIPGHSLLERAADLDIPVIALDRPNYGDSSPLDAGDSIILANARVLGDAIGELWAEHAAGASGVVLVGHSIGAAVVTAIAAQPQNWPLLGIAISGCLVRVPEESRAAWESLPDIPMIDLPTPMKDQVMFGPAGSYGDDMPAASYPSNALVPKAELLDITGTWIEGRAAVCAAVTVPVHHRQGEFDHLWITDQSEIDQFRRGFSSAPSIDTRIQPGSGHCIDFHRAGNAFQLSQLAFALECAVTAA